MKKSTSISFKIVAGISFAVSLVFLMHALGLLLNIGGYKDLYVDIIRKVANITNPSDIQLEVSLGIIDAIIGILLNSYSAGIYLRLSRSKAIILGTSKAVLYIGILQCLLLLSIIPGVMAIALSFVIRKEEIDIVNRPRTTDMQNETMDIADRIKNLKARKESGEITEEEYNKKLSDIIEQTAINNASNGVNMQVSGNLQDLISNIKKTIEKPNDENKKDNE